MGRKVHPLGFRLGIIKDHHSRWYASGKRYTEQLAEDRQIRKMVHRELPKAGISNIDIDRQPNQVHVIIDTARPGVIIGRKGASVNVLRTDLQDLTQKKVKIDVREIDRPELNALLVAESIAEQLERRISWKRAMKQAVQKTMRAGGKGIMITVSGRLGGADMGRVDTVREGRIPRHTLRADIDYGTAEANTTFGVIGIKCWIYLGEVAPGEEFHARYATEIATGSREGADATSSQSGSREGGDREGGRRDGGRRDGGRRDGGSREGSREGNRERNR